MSRNKKPRKAYRPKPVAVNNMDIARHNAAKPAPEDRAEVLAMLEKAIKALREGVATEHQWSIVAGSVTVAQAIERGGIVRGMQEHWLATEKALQHIYDRAMSLGGGRWLRVTLYFDEIDALRGFFNLHKFQMNQLGRAEFIAAIDAAQKDTIKQGHRATVVRDIERLAA